MTGDAEIDVMLAACLKTLKVKGADYTGGSPDRLNNFRQVAEDVGISMQQTWYVFFNKHLRALQTFVKNGKVESESIHGRILDLIVYLLLFEKMVLEGERTARGTSRETWEAKSKKEKEELISDELERKATSLTKALGSTPIP